MLTLTEPITIDTAHILTKDALEFIELLADNFEHRRYELLEGRYQFDERLKKGETFRFRDDTKEIRQSNWQVNPCLKGGLVDRCVEITGPASEAKMVINALNSGAKVYMADFEDSQSPTWENTIQGQVNLYEAVRQKLTYFDRAKNKRYILNRPQATLMVRPRGLHLCEQHILSGDQIPISASLVDFGLFFFHNAQELLWHGPYFYLPKIEHYEEAVWWADVFTYAADLLHINQLTIGATVLIETLPAAFEMDEILYALRNYSAGLNCGRWDYIFSFIKKLGHNPRFVMPDRSQIGMDQHFLKSYAELLVKTCHRRGAHAIGGMSAYIPVKDDEDAHKTALRNVAKDKLREVKQGFDGTWVAHPGLVPLALDVFDQYMPTMNQIHKFRDDFNVTAEDLLQVPMGQITIGGLVANIRVAIAYIESWLRGIGCVPIDNLMEDLATAEISRIQLWQWLKHGAGYRVRSDIPSPSVSFTAEKFEDNIRDALEEIKNAIGLEKMLYGQYAMATQILRDMVKMPEPPEFLSTYLMQTLIKMEEK